MTNPTQNGAAELVQRLRGYAGTHPQDYRNVAADLITAQQERIAELEGERDAARRKERDIEIRYQVWKEFYGALLCAPASNDTPLEVRVKRQARIIADMQLRIKHQRQELRRTRPRDPLAPRHGYNMARHVDKLYRLWRGEVDARSALEAHNAP